MPNRLINKVLSLYVTIRHGKVEKKLRYFYRDTYYCQLIQLKYFIQDYLVKKKYKSIEFDGEFAPELQFALPFAYWHYKNGTLKSTKSSKYTSKLYFFSPGHQETFDTRTTEGNYNFEIPRILYSHNYNMKKWLPVPLKQTYANDVFLFPKPLLIVANRYNMEWDGPPISFFDIPSLDFIFEKLGADYTIVYNRPTAKQITSDNSDIYELNEIDWIKTKHPEILLMEDVYQNYRDKVENFNHLQLMIYANAHSFLSIHGGTATLASYFGGTNIILSRKGPEHHFKCYEKLYPKLSGAKIFHAKTDDELKQLIQTVYFPTKKNTSEKS